MHTTIEALMGPDDWVMFCMYYIPSLVIAISTACVMSAGAWLARHFHKPIGCRTALCLAVVAVVCWPVYFASTSKMATILVSLNSEDARLAETVYEDDFKKEVSTVGKAVRLATDTHQAPNVRFYASCLIADLLATNSDADVTETLAMVKNAPTIEPQIIGGNSLTSEFMVPGHAPPRLFVGEIIRRRLGVLGRQE